MGLYISQKNYFSFDYWKNIYTLSVDHKQIIRVCFQGKVAKQYQSFCILYYFIKLVEIYLCV